MKQNWQFSKVLSFIICTSWSSFGKENRVRYRESTQKNEKIIMNFPCASKWETCVQFKYLWNKSDFYEGLLLIAEA